MFNTAGMRFMWRVFFALSVVPLVGVLGACTHAPTDEPGKPENWVVENVVSKSTAELYAEWVKPAVFERSSSKVINGYTVESGKLRMPDKSEGALVTVRSPDGGLTAFINKPETSGSLHIDSKGAGRFIPVSDDNSDIEDTVPNPNEKVATAPAKSTNAEPLVVEILMGYSKAGVVRAGGDAMADALAKIEYVNLALRNSLVTNVLFKLVGIQIVEQDQQITNDTLNKLSTIFALGIARFNPDVFYGSFASFAPSGPAGIAWRPGRIGIAISHSFPTFAHELAHNAGSDHCNVNGVNDYRFGYYNGKTGTMLCVQNRQAYFSNPDVKDEYGLPRGNAVTANTARVWRENAQRLSSYTPPSPYANLSANIIGPSPDSNYSIGCLKGTVMSGRGHEGRMNSGSTNYLCVLPKVGSATVSLTQQVWSGWGHTDVYCPANSVLNGIEQKGTQLRAGCTKLVASGSAVTVRYAGSHGNFDEGNHQFACPTGQYITSIRSTGPSGEFKAYDCATLH
ncbi:hypothetical protein T3H00_20765 [Pseudomonas fluorescens]|jgi:hypothetical protein|uniref:hypothetical protein n=1 Tax=Pseudomonas fluorescens TaxID=294 RepID=UPI002ACA9B3B|nr:hypothetical protein [Pseudomonas fluorescens]MDZ5435084.1 hypothetical protein [Pseudomonas fluorescens]